MNNLEKMTMLGKMLLTNKIDELLTEKPTGDLSAFYQKRLEAFWQRPDLEKIIGKKNTADPYAAMSEVDAIYEDKGVTPLPPPFGQKAWQELLNSDASARPMAAYVHIPFCKIRCTYCSFFKKASDADLESGYVEKLLQELEQVKGKKYLRSVSVGAVFFGGGTPGTLTKEQLAALLSKIREVLPLAPDCEITVESSIYDMDEEKLQTCIANGATRFSFGVQTFDTQLRRKLGRPDSCEEVVRKLKSFAATGAKVIIDLIYGLPGQTKETLLRDLQLFLDCNISGIDLYKLQIFPGTPLAKQFEAQKQIFPTGKDLAELYIAGSKFLNNNGARQLSCCHWATDNRENSRYNTMVKEGAQVLAFGAGCGGSIGSYAFMQPADLAKYSALVDKGDKPFVMLFKRDEFAALFTAITGQFDRGFFEPEKLEAISAIPFAKLLAPLIDQWQANGLLLPHNGGYKLTPMGLFWQNQMNRAVMIAAQYIVYGPRIASRKPNASIMGAMTNRK